MKKVSLCTLIFMLLFYSFGYAQCDQESARKVINLVSEEGEGLATRYETDPDSSVVWYIWKDNWYGLTKEKRYNLLKALAISEDCLRPKKTVIIKVAGKDIAKGNAYLREFELND